MIFQLSDYLELMESKPKKRGRPRKNIEKSKPVSKNGENKEENIVCFLALSDDDVSDDDSVSDASNASNASNASEESSETSGEDNRFTVNDTETKHSANSKKRNTALSISESGSESDSSSEIFGPNRCTNIKTLIEEIKKRDVIINNLRGKGAGILSTYTATRQNNIDYHCTIVANNETGTVFTPKQTGLHCWWCDHGFDSLPVYIPNQYKNGIYYVFGNFCSFNCAGKYNNAMLNDYKYQTRYSLLQNLKIKITGSTQPIKFAPQRELLNTKGGPYTIEQFRKGFTICSLDLHMNMPPLMPLVHTIEEKVRDKE